MTIYVPKLHELPPGEMARLVPTAKCSQRRTAGGLTAYVYDWPDLRVIVNIMPDADRPQRLEQFVQWLEGRARFLGQPLDCELADDPLDRPRPRLCRRKGTDCDVWHDRVQDMVGMICFNTRSIVFWEGMIFDENCSQLWPPAG
jgi:hypothetical protein